MALPCNLEVADILYDYIQTIFFCLVCQLACCPLNSYMLLKKGKEHCIEYLPELKSGHCGLHLLGQ